MKILSYINRSQNQKLLTPKYTHISYVTLKKMSIYEFQKWMYMHKDQEGELMSKEVKEGFEGFMHRA